MDIVTRYDFWLYDGGKYMMTADYSGGSISAFPIVDGVRNSEIILYTGISET